MPPSDPREEAWASAFNAYLSASLHPTAAREKADEALKLYEERWPSMKAVTFVGGGVDVSMLSRAVSYLETENRFDACKVLKSLVEALTKAQAEGKRLTGWLPPPRGM